ADEVPVLDLPTDYPRPRKQSFQGATLSFTLGEEIKKSVRKLCEKTNTTEYMVFLSAFMVLLQKYSGQDDVVVGSPISGRLHHDTETMLGMFVNTLAMRGQPEGKKSFEQFLQEMKETTLQAYEHQEYPFEELVEQVDVQRDLSRNPIFDHMLVLQNQENNQLSDHKGFRNINHDSTISKFDLTLNIDIEKQGYVLQWEYCTALFQEETIRQIAERMTYLLQSLSEQLSQPIEEISLITEKERQQVLTDFNPEATSYPKEKTIDALWLEQVQRHPDREAVVTANESVSYVELEQRANQLWGELQRNGVKPGSLIGIATEKSVDMIAGLLAILKHGCGYVPLEADYPTKRLHQMIEDCQIETVLCGECHWTELEAVGVPQLLPLHGDYQEGTTESKGSANDVAYVIFTSGSTGQPKGVMVEHRNVVRLVKNQDYVALESARVLQTGALSFDASTFEIWGPLLNGGTVALVETDIVTDPSQLRNALETYAINTMWMTAQLFNNLVDLDVDVFTPLESLLIGGEKLSEAHVERFLAHHSIQLMNGYGPTENTTFSLYYPIQPGDTRLPIGRPLQHSSAYILQGEQLAGIGMPGELCVGGDGVARGYLKQPVLTAEKFVENPYQPGERLYRTGDLARWLPDGTIEYLGRIDDQVKIRGFRIELGEIEQVMKQQAGIQDVAVLVQTAPTGEPFLSAYVVYHDRTEKPDSDQLKAQLRWELPDYMIPATVTEMDQLPVTRNGKLNHQALPVPTFTSSTAYAAPENEREELLVTIYQEVLGLEKIGIDDPFFEIGGDSIKAIRIISKMREVGFELDYEMMFQEKTIRGIANKLKNVAADRLAESQKTITGLYELSPIQHEFLNWSFPKPHHFNQAIMLYTQEKLEDNMVDSVLNELVIHHDMLRAVLADGKQRIRRVDEDNLYKLKVYDLEHITSEGEIKTQIEGECESIQASIDLENGPLFQVALYHTSKGTHLFICVHHFVMDGVSWRILLEDFTIAYSQLQEKEPVKLPLKTMAYPDWQQALIAHGETYVARQEIPYWEGVVDTLQTIDNPSFVEKGQDLFSYDIEISEELTSSLLYEAGRAYNTEINELLLSALGWALYQTAGIKQVGIELEGHGRYPLEQSVNIDRTIGWFTNIYPVILEVVPDDIGRTIKEIKERLRNVPNNGLTYGVFKHLVETKLQDKQKQLPLGISFNYLGNIHENESGMFESSMLHPGKMSADENDHGKSMTIDGVIEQKRLRFTIQFRSSSHDQTLMNIFCTHFEAALKAVINHCLTVEEGQFTISDYGDHVEWDENELEDVLELYVGEEND
ncbi:non-ribosomal peptide synthetase, partial [Bacillus sp. SD088]|uniref:non-ribosomal peptide synthetase n=1 Tax=Bacillus sp. SD088 TaxID=2782012 RepID=UPI001A95BF1F